MHARFHLQANTQMVVTVGQMGYFSPTYVGGLGGGCTTVCFVTHGSTAFPSYPAIVAGGGGGGISVSTGGTSNGGNATALNSGSNPCISASVLPGGAGYSVDGVVGAPVNAGGGWTTSKLSAGGANLGGFGGGTAMGGSNVGGGGGGYIGGNGGGSSGANTPGSGGTNWIDTLSLNGVGTYLSSGSLGLNSNLNGMLIIRKCV